MPTECAVVKFTDNPITFDSVWRRWPDYPPCLDWPPQRRIVTPAGPSDIGYEETPYRFVEIVRVDWDKPGKYFNKTSETLVIDALTLTGTRVWTPWTQQEIDDDVAASTQRDIDKYLLTGEASIDMAVINDGKNQGQQMTPAEFVVWVNANWNDRT